MKHQSERVVSIITLLAIGSCFPNSWDLPFIFGLRIELLTEIRQLFLFTLCLAVAVRWFRFRQTLWIDFVAFFPGVLLVTLLLMAFIWKFVSDIPIDNFLMTDSGDRLISTLWKVLGPNTAILVLVFTLLVVTGLLLGVQWAEQKLRLSRKLPSATLALLIGFVVLRSVQDMSVSAEDRGFFYDDRWRDRLELVALPEKSIEPKHRENVIFLKLESVNALALNQGKYLKELQSIAAQGTYFPEFWGNTVQTHRAFETMMCGIEGNVGPAFSERDEPFPGNCLPQILRNSGYESIYLYGYYELGFARIGDLIPKLGFAKTFYGNELMDDTDPRAPWGYDDCRYYDRVWDKLFQFKRPYFAYLEVSSHHYPFTPRKEYRKYHPFPNQTGLLERYVNSAVEQDHCLAGFYRRFQTSEDFKNTHLFVVGDHSFPVGLRGSRSNMKGVSNENFLVPMLYVPPQNRRADFEVGKVKPEKFSQAEIGPTILELLDEKPRKRSFAQSLRKAPRQNVEKFDRCFILSQPFDGGHLVVARDDKKWSYAFSGKKVVKIDMVSDPEEKYPRLLSQDTPLLEFIERYGCERMKERMLGTIAAE